MATTYDGLERPDAVASNTHRIRHPLARDEHRAVCDAYQPPSQRNGVCIRRSCGNPRRFDLQMHACSCGDRLLSAEAMTPGNTERCHEDYLKSTHRCLPCVSRRVRQGGQVAVK